MSMTEGRLASSLSDAADGMAAPRPLRIAYFLHDLSDPAAERRVRMLSLGGAEVTVLGFRRSAEAPDRLADARAVDLGRTYDSRMLQRAWMAGRWAMRAGTLAKLAQGADVILARNLEMLAVAAAVRRRMQPRPTLVYECLDIHRLMLADGPAGAAMRALEARLMAEASTLVVSSPAFLSAYFVPRHGVGGPRGPRSVMVENKVLAGAPPAMVGPRSASRPWRILWPGVIRCQRSLEMLKALATRRSDLLEVVIRGRPTTAVFPDLAAELAGQPGMRFDGPFMADELPGLYRDTHFTWAVDYFDEGRNSSWLLPNRLYESGYYGSVAIARGDVETGRWLRQRGLGVILDDPERELEAFLDQQTAETYARLEAASLAAPRSLFCAEEAACEDLVRALSPR
jgi:succinoglycan biosynthesis protein ExoL